MRPKNVIGIERRRKNPELSIGVMIHEHRYKLSSADERENIKLSELSIDVSKAEKFKFKRPENGIGGIEKQFSLKRGDFRNIIINL